MTIDQGEWLFEKIQEQLRHDWKQWRDIYANSKGLTYEQSLANFLESYFGGVYDINTRVATIDSELRCFEVFNFVQGNDEIDLVASFKEAKPKIMFETGSGAGELKWVPYVAVAFICEVKSQLTKQAIESDFDKLKSISQLNPTIKNRFKASMGGKYTIWDPLQCLVYDRESIADETLDNILMKNQEHWHMVLIVENDTLILNRSLPFSEIFVPFSDGLSDGFSDAFLPEGLPDIPPEFLAMSEEVVAMLEEKEDIDFDPEDIDFNPDIITLDNGLFWFLITISASIPDPLSVNTADTLHALSGGSMSVWRGTVTDTN
ncbi:DUF6602 domain-containing protein [Halalkalicoccus salilacus]|uniref:DUF6602 domain-containing protein n=1 Tax=Halalkalicoccus salilacus TaxID=3117459 RepID=UPI00300E8348